MEMHHHQHQIQPPYPSTSTGSSSSSTLSVQSNSHPYFQQQQFLASGSNPAAAISAQYPTDFQSFFNSPGLVSNPNQQQQQQQQFFFDPNYRAMYSDNGAFKQPQAANQSMVSSYVAKFGGGGGDAKNGKNNSSSQAAVPSNRNSTAFN